MALPEEEAPPEKKNEVKKEEKKPVRYPKKPKKPPELLSRKKYQFKWMHLWIFLLFLAGAVCVYLMIAFVMLALTPVEKLSGAPDSSKASSPASSKEIPPDWCIAGTSKTSGTVEIRIIGMETKDSLEVCKKETYSGGALVSKVWESPDSSYRRSESYDIQTGALTGSSLVKDGCIIIYDDTGEEISNEC